MKKCISIFLVVLLLMACIPGGAQETYASTKTGESRAIAIVFDNSGSMYIGKNQAWCRATYAMEVFASMLNEGDTLQIYPMHPITVNGKEYTMNQPFEITDSSQASQIRSIYTETALGTPIESIDCAIEGLQTVEANKKYLIVLTDGDTFSKDDYALGAAGTKRELDKRIRANAGKAMTMMYLGIGSSACMPDTKQSEYFVKEQARNTEDVLSTLTDMCNQIFGRDTLPKSRLSGKTIEFDISMSKLIVFVQGENISNLRITGSGAGQLVSTQQTKYSTAGCGNYTSTPDASLQGMIVTYANCASGSYTIDYTGTATSVEVYYEPDADLDFIFTDKDGNAVDPNALYPGDYKVSFGMKDAQTGQLISSDLLGNPTYRGSYSINGKKQTISCNGNRGEVSVTLNKNDKFDANLTVTYLSGYTISKDTTDFGWPTGGITVSLRPAGELRLDITGGAPEYPLQDLENGASYTAKVYYNGQLLTGDALRDVVLEWNPDTSNVEIRKEFAGDHYKLSLHYKNPAAPQTTVCGKCTVDIYARYTAPESREAQAQCAMTYNVTDNFGSLQMEITVPEDYIVIKELDGSKAIIIRLKMAGAGLDAGTFQEVQLQVDCGGIKHTVTADEQNSSYLIKLLSTEGITEGDYLIRVTARYTDHIGRTTESEGAAAVTLSTIPLWVRWLIGLILLVIFFILLWIILHIRVLPKYMHTTRRLSSMSFDGDDVTQSTNFLAEIRKKSAKVQSQYAGRKFGVSMDVTPGKESYLYKSQKRRSAEVKVVSVRKFGPAKIEEAMIGSVKYVMDETSGKLTPALPNQKPFALTNGMMVKYSGKLQDAGVEKDFEVTSKLNFKKK